MPEHAICLRNFHQCYKPFQNLSKKELAVVHRIVFEELCKAVKENCLIPDVLCAINLLFFNLKTFDYQNPYDEEPHLCPDTFALMEQVEYAKMMQRAAVKIQAAFKSWYIRAMLKKTYQAHKQYFGELISSSFLPLLNYLDRNFRCVETNLCGYFFIRQTFSLLPCFAKKSL